MNISENLPREKRMSRMYDAVEGMTLALRAFFQDSSNPFFILPSPPFIVKPVLAFISNTLQCKYST